MAKDTCCSRTHKTSSQLEPSYFRNCPTIILRILLASEKKKGIYQIRHLHVYFYSPLNLFHTCHKYDTGIRKIGTHILIIISCIFRHYSRSFARMYHMGLFDGFQKYVFLFFFSLQFGAFIFDGQHFGYIRSKYITIAKIMLYYLYYKILNQSLSIRQMWTRGSG